jgi:hypothetical protein
VFFLEKKKKIDEELKGDWLYKSGCPFLIQNSKELKNIHGNHLKRSLKEILK